MCFFILMVKYNMVFQLLTMWVSQKFVSKEQLKFRLSVACPSEFLDLDLMFSFFCSCDLILSYKSTIISLCELLVYVKDLGIGFHVRNNLSLRACKLAG